MIRKFWFPLVLVFIAIPALAVAQGTLPDATDPAASGSFVWRLYKAGHLIPAIVVGLFAALTIAQKRIAWLRVGWRKLALSIALPAIGELAERVADGTTPNFGMLAGTVGVALALWMKTHGEPAPAKSEPAGN